MKNIQIAIATLVLCTLASTIISAFKSTKPPDVITFISLAEEFRTVKKGDTLVVFNDGQMEDIGIYHHGYILGPHDHLAICTTDVIPEPVIAHTSIKFLHIVEDISAYKPGDTISMHEQHDTTFVTWKEVFPSGELYKLIGE